MLGIFCVCLIKSNLIGHASVIVASVFSYSVLGVASLGKKGRMVCSFRMKSPICSP